MADAKARFSELLDKAHDAPQMVTRKGKPVAIIVDIDEWTRKTRRKGSLTEFFSDSPLAGSNLDVARCPDESRDSPL